MSIEGKYRSPPNTLYAEKISPENFLEGASRHKRQLRSRVGKSGNPGRVFERKGLRSVSLVDRALCGVMDLRTFFDVYAENATCPGVVGEHGNEDPRWV